MDRWQPAGQRRFVPPPPEDVLDTLSVLERWWHAECDLPPLARAGLAHVQFVHAIVAGDRGRILAHDRSSVAAVRLLEHLPSNPVVTVPRAAGLLRLTAPPTRKAIELLESLGVLREISGKRRGRAYAYHEYVDALIGPDG